MSNATTRKKIAIVTGASAGLGVEFARQIERGYYLDEIWLVARRSEPMKDLGSSFHKSQAVVLALDVTNEGDLAILKKRITDENPQIEFLVNNAGCGKIGPFSDLGLEEQLGMVELNVKTLTHITYIAIPYMMPGSKLIQVASAIGFCPAPYFAVYAATKAYVVFLSEALSLELKERGIGVTAVCPGPVATEFFAQAQKNEFMKDKVADAEPFNQFLTATATDVVAKALSDAEKGKRRSVYSWMIKLFVALLPFVPRGLALRMLSRRRPH